MTKSVFKVWNVRRNFHQPLLAGKRKQCGEQNHPRAIVTSWQQQSHLPGAGLLPFLQFLFGTKGEMGSDRLSCDPLKLRDRRILSTPNLQTSKFNLGLGRDEAKPLAPKAPKKTENVNQ